MEQLATDAADQLSFTAAVAARTKVSTLRGELARLRDEAAANREKDPLKRVRRLRRRAAEDGSWVAAANLLKQEQELQEKLEAEKRARDEERRAHVDDDGLVETLVSHVKLLPATLRRRVRARLAEALGDE